MRKIKFYKTIEGKCYVEEFLDSLSGKEIKKVVWTFKLIEDLEIVPKIYFKKLKHVENIWEVKVDGINKTYRILGFIHENNFVILNHAFIKKNTENSKKCNWYCYK